MGEVWCRLIVCFEDPFWVGVFERIQDGKLAAAKVTFGSEPKDYEVSEFILRRYYSLQFSPAVETAVKDREKNPKRMQRDVKRQMENTGIGTKSQQALKLQQEQNKKMRKEKSREKKLAESERRFEMKQQKEKRETPGQVMPWCFLTSLILGEGYNGKRSGSERYKPCCCIRALDESS